MRLKLLVTLCLFLGIGLPQTVLSAEQLDVEIRSTILNIRQARSTNSPVVGVLHQGERLSVTTTNERDWVQLNDKRGFISVHYVNILSRSPVTAPPAAPTAPAQKTKALESTITPLNTPPYPSSIPEIKPKALAIQSISKTCRQNLSNHAYEHCQLVFTLELTKQNSTTKASKLTCYAAALTTDEHGIDKHYKLSNSRIINPNTATVQMILEWFPVSQETIKTLALREDICELSPYK